MTTLTIVGAGGWGTALAIVLAPRFDRLRLWVFERDLADDMRSGRENTVFLPGYRIPEQVEIVTELDAALADVGIVLGAMPSQHARRLYSEAAPHLRRGTVVVSATKGLETGSLLRMSEVAQQTLGRGFRSRVAVLSGPTFAREIARGEPAAVVIASENLGLAQEIQEAFSGPALRLYTNTDTIGVEIGAALKNVIAIAAGVCHGLGLGNNTMAALITRGLAEITRLAVAMGARPRTLSGLAGLGDLVLTCTGDLSRNRMVGLELARGRRLDEILASTRVVAEGVYTTRAAVDLAARVGVELPITKQMEAMLSFGKPPKEAIRELMERSLKGE